ncbi:root UVB sensitive protein [Chloropicon primus]|uniref:Root UVB sensitive protein n=1 Tax=Chloropicon primus TaxID=1764295 RepID=A0A5B8MB66_9CHLO|nr:root UVB sensitive protein [Chloropicon primus]UPQ96791.1 root UVB sensitive protein [Chloropicon primus]|eukprot:QDZ17573.1 root UVB sensitive protein [Chloropicon primus]
MALQEKERRRGVGEGGERKGGGGGRRRENTNRRRRGRWLGNLERESRKRLGSISQALRGKVVARLEAKGNKGKQKGEVGGGGGNGSRRARGERGSRLLAPIAEMIGGKKVQLEVFRDRVRSRKEGKGGSSLRETLGRLSREAFIPENVSPDYWNYVRWRFLQRITSSILSVYTTESMLRAVGVGAKRSLPTAAAFNWLLKDGIGKLGKLGIVTKLGSQYDLELKKFRFLSTVVCDIACGLEMLTPLSPQNFLLLASIGNVGKSVGLSIALATQPAFHKKFAMADNMADITAKSQAQHVVADTLGLGCALGLSHLMQSVSPQMRLALPFLSFPFLAAADIVLVKKELRAIELKTLNRDRLQVLASHWVGSGRQVVPSGTMSKIENITFFPFSPEGTWPLQVDSVSQSLTDVGSLCVYLKHYEKEEYMLIPGKRGPLARKTLRLVFSASATERDLLKGVLQASYFRTLQGKSHSESEVIRRSKRLAEQNMNQFERDVRSAGWQTRPMLLFDSKYPGYVLDLDWKRKLESLQQQQKDVVDV